MNDFPVDNLVKAFHVWKVEFLDGLDRHSQRLVSTTALVQVLARRAQETENLSPIEPLPFAMLAKTHGDECIRVLG